MTNNLPIDIKSLELELKGAILEIPDFPKKGILFKDITPILKDGSLFQRTVHFFAERYRKKDLEAIVCIESRGFLLGAPLASELGVSLIPVRKKGKLPRKTLQVAYRLEYGVDSLEIHREDLKEHQRVLIVDDVLATGGTTGAVVELIEKLGGQIVEMAFLIELLDLKGRDHLKKYPVFSLIQY